MLQEATPEKRTFLSIAETWEAFKQKRTATDLYNSGAVIMYAASMVGVRGDTQIRRFFLNYQFSEKCVSVKEQVYNTLMSDERLIEEVVWTVHFLAGECKWLVPNIEDRFLTNATIKSPVTTSVRFDQENRIESIRYIWDQASVLKQLKIISEKSIWPVHGEYQVNTLVSPETVKLMSLDNEEVSIDYQSTQKKQDQTAFAPGRIFGPVDPKDQVKISIRRAEPTAPPPRNIFTYQPPSQRPMVAHQPNKLGSSFTFTHDEGDNNSTNKLAKSFSATTVSENQPSTKDIMPTAGKTTPTISRNIFG